MNLLPATYSIIERTSPLCDHNLRTALCTIYHRFAACTLYVPGMYVLYTTAGVLVCGPRAYQDQFRGFKSHRVHARRDFFLNKKVISGKRESVSWPHSMKIDEQWEC